MKEIIVGLRLNNTYWHVADLTLNLSMPFLAPLNVSRINIKVNRISKEMKSVINDYERQRNMSERL